MNQTSQLFPFIYDTFKGAGCNVYLPAYEGNRGQSSQGQLIEEVVRGSSEPSDSTFADDILKKLLFR